MTASSVEWSWLLVSQWILLILRAVSASLVFWCGQAGPSLAALVPIQCAGGSCGLPGGQEAPLSGKHAQWPFFPWLISLWLQARHAVFVLFSGSWEVPPQVLETSRPLVCTEGHRMTDQTLSWKIIIAKAASPFDLCLSNLVRILIGKRKGQLLVFLGGMGLTYFPICWKFWSEISLSLLARLENHLSGPIPPLLASFPWSTGNLCLPFPLSLSPFFPLTLLPSSLSSLPVYIPSLLPFLFPPFCL